MTSEFLNGVVLIGGVFFGFLGLVYLSDRWEKYRREKRLARWSASFDEIDHE